MACIAVPLAALEELPVRVEPCPQLSNLDLRGLQLPSKLSNFFTKGGDPVVFRSRPSNSSARAQRVVHSLPRDIELARELRRAELWMLALVVADSFRIGLLCTHTGTLARNRGKTIRAT
jgi:hypothetical protein